MTERRVKEVCIYCGGEKLRFADNGEIRIICLICGKDFKAQRSIDISEFHKIADQYN
jgi:hypothetical protein